MADSGPTQPGQWDRPKWALRRPGQRVQGHATPLSRGDGMARRAQGRRLHRVRRCSRSTLRRWSRLRRSVWCRALAGWATLWAATLGCSRHSEAPDVPPAPGQVLSHGW